MSGATWNNRLILLTVTFVLSAGTRPTSPKLTYRDVRPVGGNPPYQYIMAGSPNAHEC
ncbi:hypothetical protein [Spirosoma migulaei]